MSAKGQERLCAVPAFEVRFIYRLRRQLAFSRLVGKRLEEPWAQVETVSQHQQRNEQAGRAQKRELPENLVLIDGDYGARKRSCDSSHV